MSVYVYTLRIYEPDLVKDISELKQKFSSFDMNKFLTFLIKLGIVKIREVDFNQVANQENFGKATAEYEEAIETLIVALNELHKGSDITLKMLSAIHAMCEAQNENRHLLPSKIGSGLYDSLPQRFASLSSDNRAHGDST